MNVLCLDTSFSEAKIAVKAGEIKILDVLDSNAKHSENLLPTIEKTLKSAKLEVCDLDYISCVVGPGSFTGLRISIATAKAMMFAFQNIKAVGICSLEALAYCYFLKNKNAKEVVCLMDALSDKLFVAVFSRTLTAKLEPKMIEKAELPEIIAGKSDFACFKCEADKFNVTGIDVSASALLDLTVSKINEGKIISENELVPLYLRLSQAEDELNKRENK